MPNQGILLKLDFVSKVVYTKYTKKKAIFLAAPVIEIVNQILFVSQKKPKE